MPKEVQISPVPAARYAEALRFVAAGAARGALGDAQAASLAAIVRDRSPDAVRLWWARRGRRCVAAALILSAAGRVGMLFASPAGARGVEADTLARVIRAAALDALAAGRAFVQALMRPDARQDISVLEAAGLAKLAELIYMKLDLSRLHEPRDAAELVWRSYDKFDENELSRVIEETYRGSLDCPGLAGSRQIADVIAAHKDMGIFSPQFWWIVASPVESGPQPPAGGCILVNEDGPHTAEVVYMGVVPRCRGRGLGGAMVHGAAEHLRERGVKALTLAVDAGNVYARRIYDSLGFVETSRRVAYMLIPAAGGRSAGKGR